MSWHNLNDVLRQASDELIEALDEYDPPPALDTKRARKMRSNQITERFIQAVPWGVAFGANDQESYESGDWLGGDATRPTD